MTPCSLPLQEKFPRYDVIRFPCFKCVGQNNGKRGNRYQEISEKLGSGGFILAVSGHVRSENWPGSLDKENIQDFVIRKRCIYAYVLCI